MIPYLNRQRLLGQYRGLAALRGKGWGRKHATVDYVFEHSFAFLVAYHYLIMDEMERRGYKPDPIWRNPRWRGKELQEQEEWCDPKLVAIILASTMISEEPIYIKEHNDTYLQECLDNLASKGITIDFS